MKRLGNMVRSFTSFGIRTALIVVLLIGCGGGGGGGDATNGAAPIAQTPIATSVSTNGAILNGGVIANGLFTNAWFEYDTDSSLTNHTHTTQQSIGSGLSPVATYIQITGLAGNTTYHFRVCASNAKGEVTSSITSFTTSSTGAAPVVTTLPATSVGANTATLNANVTANGLPTTAWFEWGTNPALLTFTSTSPQSVGSGSISQSFNAALTGLTPGTTYYFRVAASNGSGTNKGSILSFTPSAAGAAPTVTTLPATSIGGTTATLNGSVNANGQPTNVWFEYGGDPNFISNPSYPTFFFTPSQSVGPGTTSQLVTADIAGLAIGVTYYYRIVASNGSGYTRGSVLSFGPFGAPFVTTLAATSVGPTSAELNGIVTPNGMGTTLWFEYGTDPTLASSTSTSSQAVGSGTTRRSVNAGISGLTTGTTYYFRVASSNSSGTTRGIIASVTAGNTPAPGDWTATGSMVAPRFGHTATLLPNGKVLVAGGYGLPLGYLSSAELYDPGMGTWENTGSMVSPRFGHTATLLPNGKVLVAGGAQYAFGIIFSSAELYDPATGTWENTGSMVSPRFGHTATLLQNGKVLVAGGHDYYICTYGGCSHHDLFSAELFDPATGTWENTGSMVPPGGRTAILLQNGKVLVVGYGGAELYDPATGTWDNTGSMAGVLGYPILLQNGKVLVVGGGGAELYDPATGTLINTGSMNAPRRGYTATLLPSGKVLVAGGGSGDYLASAELYDPGMGTWENSGVMVAPRRGHTATLLQNGKVLVAGGGDYSGNSIDLPSAELYNP